MILDPKIVYFCTYKKADMKIKNKKLERIEIRIAKNVLDILEAEALSKGYSLSKYIRSSLARNILSTSLNYGRYSKEKQTLINNLFNSKGDYGVESRTVD